MKKVFPVLLISILTILVGWLLFDFSPAKNLDNIITDINIRYFAPPAKVSNEIVIVFLDEATMKVLPYRSPVPRDFLYELNEKILAARPKAVGYDIFFKDPTLTTNDQQLVTSFKKGPVFAVSAGKLDETGKWFEDKPMDLFNEALSGMGLADLPFSSSDAVVRMAHIPSSFVAALYRAATGARCEVQDTRIRFSGPPSKIGRDTNLFKIFPAHLVAKGLIPTDWLKDKIVLVGAAYEDGTDAYITPYFSARYNYERMPGVEIHANILNFLLTGQFYYETPKGILLIGLVFLGILSSLLFLYGPIWRGVVTATLLTLLLIAKIVLGFNWYGLIIPFVPFEGSMIVALGISLGYRSITEGRQKRFIKGVFAKYVPPSVVDKMIANPELLVLGGEQREITCLFTDIASFTTISEKLDPKALVEFLNQYLDRLTRIIFKYGGTLDKYEGDAIIAFFGAPVALENHREAALMAAIEMQKASLEISEFWKDKCGREIVTRVGINAGSAVVGNMGSDLRFDYTAIGDTMNLASRLEGANKFFGTRILASERVVASNERPASPGAKRGERATSDVMVRPVANLKVKGKTEAVKVYEVIGLKSEISQNELDKIKNQPEPTGITELDAK